MRTDKRKIAVGDMVSYDYFPNDKFIVTKITCEIGGKIVPPYCRVLAQTADSDKLNTVEANEIYFSKIKTEAIK